MSRFLTLETDERGSRVFGAASLEVIKPMVAEFGHPQFALLFLSAVANQTNNPDARAEPHDREGLSVVDHETAGQWYVIDARPDRNCVGIFADRADADLFVAFMKPDA